MLGFKLYDYIIYIFHYTKAILKHQYIPPPPQFLDQITSLFFFQLKKQKAVQTKHTFLVFLF